MLVGNKLVILLRENKKISVLILILALVTLLSDCVSNTSTGKTDIRGEAYAGSAQCRNCHQEVYDNYSHAAHFNTSSDHLPSIVKSAFEPGKNIFKFNDSVEVVMEKTDSGFYQSYYVSGKKLFSKPFEITVGSGRKAQTYLYYNDRKKISQLPISYFMSEGSWANSPGFPGDHPRFDRNVPSYCMGCHSSFIGVKQTYTGVVMQEEFEKNKIAYGIDCERCHGPARAHIDYHTDHPQEKESKFITKISTLNRTQQNDMCALCHSGFRDVQQSLFNFKPGDNLVNYYIPDYGRIDTAGLDVHGNQTQLMLASKCYQLSSTLTCNSCHNVHVKERDDLSTLSQRCITCHKQSTHSFTDTDKKRTDAIQNNCIDCHMPLKASAAITMLTKQKTDAYPDYIRTHLITIYREETKRFLDSLNKHFKSN
jgi:hypothetical protein